MRRKNSNLRLWMLAGAALALAGCGGASRPAAEAYDLVLQGGHVIDPKNGVDGVRDVAIRGGKIARVEANIPAEAAKKVADVSGLYVTPGLVDIHVHAFASAADPNVHTWHCIYPDGFSFRTGVTTMVDAGTSGWKNFPDFKERVIDRAKTRTLAFLNICGLGAQGKNEADASDMDPAAAARMIGQYKDVLVGVKSAHYPKNDWMSVDRAVEAGKLANVPVMVDFGRNFPERPIGQLFAAHLRPGDIYTHVYSGLRGEIGPDGKVSQALWDGRKRGIIFDLGHGGGSFFWPVVKQAFSEGFYPDSISTDLHTGSMNAGLKDMLYSMAKVLNGGAKLQDVVRMSTWNPANEIRRPGLGHLTPGAEADVAVLRLDEGNFGFGDSRGNRDMGKYWLTAEMTLRAGEVMWDLNGRAAEDWQSFYAGK